MAETSQMYADAVRARELYKYYKPPPSNTVTSSRAESPDTILTSFAQLVAWRLGTQRAMVSLIDRETQYFVAEATKTLNLRDNQKFEDPADALWVGCAAVGKEGRLCEKTIALPPVNNGFPLFEVSDLREDNRFNKLPFVTGPPFLKFYAGTPLTTQRGVNIGSLFVVDDKLRSGLNSDQAEFLGQMAANVMQHLEMSREAEERKRAMKMTQGLAAFVEGEGSLQTRGKANTLPHTPPYARDVKGHEKGRISKDTSKFYNDATDDSTANLPSKSPAPSEDGSLDPLKHQGNPTDVAKTFLRAASLLQQSLQLDGDGGVVFFDTKHALVGSRDTENGKGATSGSSSGDDDFGLSRRQSVQAERRGLLDPTSRPFSDTSAVGSGKHAPLAEILGLSTTDDGRLEQERTPSTRIFRQMEEVVLAKLMKRYSRGKLWAFDDEGALSSEEDPSLTMDGRHSPMSDGVKAKNDSRRLIEANVLLRYFPGARSLIFIPLWDAGSTRWFSGCFAWSTSPTQVFTPESELTFCKAFGNSVMAEVSRLESIIANQQKGDFIGSISHELRSPLHGVLASSEFLSDTSCDAYQQSLVNTINSCGQTLLDTINHVLDFSKINSFKKNWRVNGNSSNRPRSSSRTRSNGNSAGATALLVETNVAVVIEQVIESVFAGRVYQDISTLDNDLKSTADMKCDEVSVHIDVTPGDWNLITQPGALRRVIMNLFGNALKYTARGWIKVRLTFENTDKETQSVQLTVTDTGKGISSEYLRTKLYTPFAQENSLAPGTGLGLSIVRSIVNMLEGEINIRSEIGSGTEVQVSIPMVKGSSGGGTPESALSLNNNGPLAHHEIVAIVRQAAQGKTFAIHGFGTKDTTASTSHNTANTGLQLLESYLVNWFGFKVASSPSSHIDIVVANETIVADLTTAELGTPGKQNGPILLVICKSSTRSMKTSEMHDAEGIVEVISEPIGPYKLANALEICLRRYNVQRGGVSMPSNSLKTSPDQLDKATPNGPFEGFEVMTLEDSRVSPALSARNDGMLSRPNNPKALKEQSPLCNQEIGEYDAPFPSLDLPPKEISPRQSLTVTPNKASLLSEKASSPPYRDNTTPCDSPSATQTNGSKKNSEGSPLSQNTQDKKQSPEILLVDDNLINLKLLETFMKKRKYQSVKSATNGLIAVEAYNEAKRFDVIFMDISMPIMDGFEATRAIRTIEQESRANSSRRPPDPPALIIALTGLASSRDQSEAFQSGVDLYMTKPVTFRDVGKLLDDWEMNKVPTPGEWPSSDTVVS